MTATNFITPPPDLVKQWVTEVWHEGTSARLSLSDMHIAAEAAIWAADQELEACCEWLGDAPVVYNDNADLHPGSYLRDARRPKSPSLKKQALGIIDDNIEDGPAHISFALEEIKTIRRALSQLPNE